MADNKKILIIEDDPDISMIEEAYLQASGFETKILSDGEWDIIGTTRENSSIYAACVA